MRSKTLAFFVILTAAVFAAGGGAYIAVRQNAAGVGSALAPLANSPVDSQAAARPAPDAAAAGEKAGAARPAPAAAPETPGTPVEPAPTATVSSPAAAGTRGAVRPTAPPRQPVSHSVLPTDAGSLPAAPPDSAPEAVVSPVVLIPPVATDVAPPEAAIAWPHNQPPAKEYVELVVPADSVIGLQIETTVHSGRARLEDRVDARVSRDVRVDGRVAIPEGSEVSGVVTLVEPGGRVKHAARIGVQFDTVRLSDGTRVTLATETIVREGESPAGRSTARIGGAAIGGAILGAIFGGGKGAAIGGSVGAAGGAAAAMSGEPNEVVLPAGSVVSARLLRPVAVVVEK